MLSPHVAAGVSPEQLDALLRAPQQLDVHYQPIIGFDTRVVVGAEALLRVQLDAGHATNDGIEPVDATVALADARMYAAKARSKQDAATAGG